MRGRTAMKTVLVTGGGGLIGQAIVDRHLAAGDDVYVYDNRANSFNDYSALRGTDISGIGSLDELVTYRKFDIVSHQAAFVGVGESQYNVLKYVDNNVTFTAKLLQAFVSNKGFMPELFMLAGSMGPYGEGPYRCPQHGIFYPSRDGVGGPACPVCAQPMTPQAIDESCELHPKSVYGFTKKAQEDLLRVFSQTYRMRAISLRYFSVYGLNSNPNNPFTGVLSVIANKIINSPQVCMYEDGEQTRDLICADDVGAAHFAATRMREDFLFEAFNIGTEKSRSLRAISDQMIARLMPDKPLVFTGEYRFGDIKHSQAVCRKFRALTGWEPKVTLDEAIEQYCRFVREHWSRFSTAEDTSSMEHLRLKEKGLI